MSMTRVFLVFGLCMTVHATHAAARPNASNISCAAINARIASAGALVLGTGPTTYERYVRDLGFCQASQITVPEFIRSADNPQCLVYRCAARTMHKRR
jgi:hypothetical protein